MEGLQQQTEITEAHLRTYEKAKARLLEIFQKRDEQEMKEVFLEVEKFARAAQITGFDVDCVLAEIKKSFEQEDPNLFVETVFNLVKPILDKKVEHPEFFEVIRRERVMEHGDNIKLSELMYYNVDLENGTAHIHVAAKGNMSLGDVLKAFRGGMKELARQVNQDERIKEIQATSWIVASNPKLLKKSGFTVEGAIDEKTRAEHFADEERPVSWAHMSRETLLEKYLDK